MSHTHSLYAQAERFLRQYWKESDQSFALGARLIAVADEIRSTGTYVHSGDELTYGARLAWRNQPRCIVRLMWRSLQVFDRRELTRASDIFEACADHLRWSTNEGAIRPAITVFRPRAPGLPDLRFANAQLVSWAGFAGEDGVVGDPLNLDLTRRALELGWSGARSRFTRLPLILGDEWAELPAGSVLEVELGHPDYPWFEELGLRWYALPAIANMELEIGGIVYTAAPFSGYYMVTEVGARDLGDESRYNQLPAVAEGLGLNTGDRTSLWKDRALHELNRAVLWSFARSNVTMVDHHAAAVQFMHFCRLETEAGRQPSAEWMWIVPPTAGSATPVFQARMKNLRLTPQFRYARQAQEMSPGCPVEMTVDVGNPS